MWLSILIPVLLAILVIVCVLLILVVLMQRPKNEGLGAAFGSGVTENIFGAQTASVLTKTTVYLGCIFFGVTLLLTVLTARRSLERRTGVLENEVRKAAVPQASVSPGALSSRQASASSTSSVTPAASAAATPEASTSPAASASATQAASASPSPSATTESSPSPTAASSPIATAAEPSPAASASPAPLASPQH